MHINDIKGFAARVNLTQLYAGKRVVLRAPKEKGGLYLTAKGVFDGERKDAFKFDFDRDNIAKQVDTCVQNEMPIEVELAE